jgi:hypothetical protein
VAAMIWREKRVLLIILGLLLAANTIFFFTYRVQYETRLQDLEDRREQSEAKLAQAKAMRSTSERRVAAYRKAQQDVRDIYNQQWSTEQERLSAWITEIKRLAVASQLVPKSISFLRTAESQRRGRVSAEVVGINFTVQGPYEQVRRLINLLELSRQFVIIDQISLNSAENDTLTLNLQLKTLFRDVSTAGAPKEL